MVNVLSPADRRSAFANAPIGVMMTMTRSASSRMKADWSACSSPASLSPSIRVTS